MTTTTWTSVPAGMLGQGNADVRPYPGVVVRPAAEPARGTGLPAVGFAGDTRTACGDGARTRALTVLARFDAPAAEKSIAQQSTQNDGTTLGIHSPGRPQS